MKKHLFILGFAMLLSAASAFAQDCDHSGTTGTLEWCLKDGTLTISGEGAMPDYVWGGAPWYPYQESIITAVIPNSVTTIGDYAFLSCSALASVTIPNSVITIGKYAFYSCYTLESITISNSVITIGEKVFESCMALESITVDNGNPNYSSADGVLFNKNKTTLICYPAGKKENSYVIPNSVTTIEDYAFSGCIALESVTIPNSVTTIGREAFYYCTALESITIPNSVIMIGSSAFSWCTALKSITIPNGITTIGVGTFSNCAVLESITIPNSVTWIEGHAFDFCTALESITIPSSVTWIGNYAFAYCTSLTSVTNLNPVPVEIPSNVFEDINQSACTLNVPTSAVSAYQTAEVWKEFNIEGIDVGIAEPDNNPSLRIYPNPTTGLLWVDCRDAINRVSTMTPTTIMNIVIYDVMGRVVHVETQCIASLQSQIAPPPAPSKGGEFRKSEIGQSQIEMNISHLPQGVYGVSVISDGRVVGNGKVVKM